MIYYMVNMIYYMAWQQGCDFFFWTEGGLLDQKPQLSAQEVTETRCIAEVRIHVERAIGRIKNYWILQGILAITLAASVSQIFYCMCNPH